MQSNFYKEVGKKIQRFRKEKRISQRSLAEKIGKVSPTYINLIESGKRRVSLESLIKISKALDTDLNALLEYHRKTLDPSSLLELALDSYPGLSVDKKNTLIKLAEFLNQD